MDTWGDFDYEEPAFVEEDSYEASARDTLAEFFDSNSTSVFFGNQIAVQNEDRYFHWITFRAISSLVGLGHLRSERRRLSTGSEIKLIWHRKHRYHQRDAKRVVSLVNEYGSPNMCAAMGLHGEQMILSGFAKKQFVLRGHNTNEFLGRRWTETDHNLDFISG